MKTEEKKLLNNIGRGVLWMLLTALFGLLQLWLVIGYNSVVRHDILSYHDFIHQGFILFFISAVVTTISVDFFLSDLEFSRTIVGFLFVLFPLVVLLLSVGLFLICLDKKSTDLDLETIEALQLTLITMTVIYAITIKTLKFHYSNA